MSNINNYSSWAEIDLDAIRNNVRFVAQLTQVPVMAIVKANGYGHGAVPVARAALEGGAAWCGVARFEEALELRNSGLECPILLLGYTPPGKYSEAIEKQISMTVWDEKQCNALAEAACKLKIPAKLHVKVDTGMSRLGVQVEQAAKLIEALNSNKNILFEGLFTHFACADDIDPQSTDKQILLFNNLIAELSSKNLLPKLIHASNSAGIYRRLDARYNLVRLGIALYGLQPSKEWQLPPEIHPALTWKSVLSQVKLLPANRGISYGHTYFTQKEEKIGTIAVGYADGFRRTTGNVVLIHGKRAPVVGRVCMDQIMVNLDNIPEAKAGDEVVLIGKQGDACLTAEEIAGLWNTINYEVVCGIGARVPRIYI